MATLAVQDKNVSYLHKVTGNYYKSSLVSDRSIFCPSLGARSLGRIHIPDGMQYVKTKLCFFSGDKTQGEFTRIRHLVTYRTFVTRFF